MQDRQPGAPGQYKATLSAAEFQKMQAGEQFTITMIRDDQPIVEGTPYSKAAVLPDDLAAIICPDVLNPSPADALRALLPRNGKVFMTANLPMGGHRVTGLGDPVADGDAVPFGYAKKVGNPHNLLDNSDFRNPVNQRGKTNYDTTGYTIDRWGFSESVEAVLQVQRKADGMPENRIAILVGAGYADFYQHLENYEQMAGKTYTFAVNIKGTVHTCTFKMGQAAGGYPMGNDGAVFYSLPNVPIMIRATTSPGFNMYWVALYEGEYTAETLPEYQPKGYAVELAECMRYYQHNASGLFVAPSSNLYVALQFPMRIIPTITVANTNGVDCSLSNVTQNGFILTNNTGYTSQSTWTASADL